MILKILNEDFRKVQRQIYCKIVQVSLRPFSSYFWFFTKSRGHMPPVPPVSYLSVVLSTNAKTCFFSLSRSFYLFLQRVCVRDPKCSYYPPQFIYTNFRQTTNVLWCSEFLVYLHFTIIFASFFVGDFNNFIESF